LNPLNQIARTLSALFSGWTWPIWPVRGIGLTGASQLSVLAGPDRSDRSVAPVWPVLPSQCTSLCFVHILSYASWFLFVSHTCCTPLILRYRGSSHALSSKFVLLAFETNKFTSKHKLRGSSSYI
jgi:hypothetical protein